MKKLGIFGILLLGLPGIIHAAPVKMVTYFPAPYVAYSRLGPNNMVGGLGRNHMVGGLSVAGPNDYFLRVGTPNLAYPNLPLYVQNLLLQEPNRTIGYRTRLELTSDSPFTVVSNLVRVGSTQTIRSNGEATSNPGDQRQVWFKQNLQVTQQPKTRVFYSINADTIDVPDLYLFGLKMPACNNTETSGDRHRISWRTATVKLSNTNVAPMSGTFLTCGDIQSCHCNGLVWDDDNGSFVQTGEWCDNENWVECYEYGPCTTEGEEHICQECNSSHIEIHKYVCTRCDSSWSLCNACHTTVGWPCYTGPGGGGGGGGTGGEVPGQQDDDIKEKEKNL
ncbi:MAG: hypothetical protein IKP06_02605 [Elusimicrobiaceae bacterium]|nr:hypothetical protein [Elusimicrobiaceae bacterium]